MCVRREVQPRWKYLSDSGTDICLSIVWGRHIHLPAWWLRQTQTFVYRFLSETTVSYKHLPETGICLPDVWNDNRRLFFYLQFARNHNFCKQAKKAKLIY